MFLPVTLTIKTRNTLDCDQSNVSSSRVIFSTISQDLPFHSFSLYSRSASDPPLSLADLRYKEKEKKEKSDFEK